MTKSKTQELIDFIEQHGTVRLSVIRKEFKLPPSTVRVFLTTAIRKGWVLACELTRDEGKEQDVEYRIGTAYTRAAAAKLADEVPTFTNVSKLDKPGSNPMPTGKKPAPPPNPPDAKNEQPKAGEITSENAENAHEAHARELLDALNRINALEGELHKAKNPANWDAATMIQQLQYHLADGVEFLIGPTRLHLLDGEARYEVTNPDELLQTLDSIRFLKQRKVA